MQRLWLASKHLLPIQVFLLVHRSLSNFARSAICAVPQYCRSKLSRPTPWWEGRETWRRNDDSPAIGTGLCSELRYTIESISTLLKSEQKSPSGGIFEGSVKKNYSLLRTVSISSSISRCHWKSTTPLSWKGDTLHNSRIALFILSFYTAPVSPTRNSLFKVWELQW